MSPAAAAAGIAILLMTLLAGVDPRPALAAPILAPGSFATPPVAVGGNHICVLPGDGTVLCWGDNTFGQVGKGEFTDPSLPAGDVLVQQTVVADAAGAGGENCVDVTADGAVLRCHGSNSLTGVTAIAAGSSHTCALLSDSTVKCWGSNAPIDGGQFSPSLSGGELGDGTTIARPVPVQVIAGHGQTTPLSGVLALSAAAGYTCALLEDGTAKCWGNAPQAISTAPITVMADATNPLAQIASISTGDRNACAALVDGSVVCWGDGLLGDQLSDTQRDGSLPVTVTVAGAPTTTLGGIAALALGHTVFNGPNGFAQGHSCALNTSGEVLCWGWNDVSQLGNGFNMVTGGFDSQRDYAVPVIDAPGSADPLRGVTAIAAGGYSTCALIDDGSVKCWGLGFGGDSFEGAGAPVPLEIAATATATANSGVALAGFRSESVQTAAAPLASVVAIAAGGGICAVLADGSLWCSDAENGMAAAPGVTVIPAAVIPTPTPIPTAGATGPDPGLVGDWAVTDGSPSVVTISFADGTYSVTAKSPVHVISSACDLPAGTLLATFSGSGGSYSGQHGLWSTADCTFSRWTPITATFDGSGQLTFTIQVSSETIVLTRQAVPTGPEAVIGEWQGGAFVISFADGLYSVTNVRARPVPGSACQIPAGMVTETFSGSGGHYVGQELGWNVSDCSTVSLPATFTLDGDRLTFVHERTGVTEVWTRSGASVLAPAPKNFRNSIPTPGEINLSPEVVIPTLAFAAGIIILVPFPGALFNSTLEGNYAEILGRVRRARRRARNVVLQPWFLLRQRLGLTFGPTMASDAGTEPAISTEPVTPAPGKPPRDFWWTFPGVGLFILLTVLLSGFLDPSFGLDVPSIATFVGMLLGLLVLLTAFDLPLAIFYRRHSIDFWLHALPATIAVSIACVLISRLTDFHPGYLYGLIIATATARQVDKPTEGKLMAAGVASSIAVAVLAWFGLGVVSPMAAATPDPGPLLITVQTALSMVVAAGVELAAFGMLPITFLVGKSIFSWNKLVWAGLIGFGWIAFGIVILNPRNGYLSDTTHTPIYTVVALLAIFGVGSILFWWYFHRRRTVQTGTAA